MIPVWKCTLLFGLNFPVNLYKELLVYSILHGVIFILLQFPILSFVTVNGTCVWNVVHPTDNTHSLVTYLLPCHLWKEQKGTEDFQNLLYMWAYLIFIYLSFNIKMFSFFSISSVRYSSCCQTFCVRLNMPSTNAKRTQWQYIDFGCNSSRYQ